MDKSNFHKFPLNFHKFAQKFVKKFVLNGKSLKGEVFNQVEKSAGDILTQLTLVKTLTILFF